MRKIKFIALYSSVRGHNSQFYKIEKFLNFVNTELQIRFFSIISFFLEGIILFQKKLHVLKIYSLVPIRSLFCSEHKKRWKCTFLLNYQYMELAILKILRGKKKLKLKWSSGMPSNCDYCRIIFFELSLSFAPL